MYSASAAFAMMNRGKLHPNELEDIYRAPDRCIERYVLTLDQGDIKVPHKTSFLGDSYYAK